MSSLTSYEKTNTIREKASNAKISITEKAYYKKNLDGTVWQRVECETKFDDSSLNIPSEKLIEIHNNDGFIQLYEGKKLAVKCPFISSMMETANQSVGAVANGTGKANDSQYELDERLISGVQIYVISEKISDAEYQKMMEEGSALSNPASPLSPSDLAANLPYLTEYYIRKSDLILMGEMTYSHDGDLIVSAVASEMIINPPLSDDLFQVPTSFKVFTAKAPEDLPDILTTN